MPTTLKHPVKPLERALARGLAPTYDINKSYEWNYRYGPLFKGPYPPEREIKKRVRLLDFELNSPLGIAAGPLLNSKWIKVYAKLGFDILSYKTVRTRKRPSNPAPNCIFIETRGPLTADRSGETLYARDRPPKSIEEISITNSFGVPSRDPGIWQPDVERAKSYIGKGQVLVVSSMGSSEDCPDRSSFINDFSHSARLAEEAGADIVELDLSCPNSNAEEGMVYLDPKLVYEIVKATNAKLRGTPLFIKVGDFKFYNKLFDLLRASAPYIQGVVGINTVKMTVMNPNGKPAIPGRPQSGVCGAGIRAASLEFLQHVLKERQQQKYDFVVIGVGGIMTWEHIQETFDREPRPDAVEVATAAMWDPYLAYRYYLEHS
jgi:dihydroorotate dehydrogenase (NAD+) catalytic subunit